MQLRGNSYFFGCLYLAGFENRKNLRQDFLLVWSRRNAVQYFVWKFYSGDFEKYIARSMPVRIQQAVRRTDWIWRWFCHRNNRIVFERKKSGQSVLHGTPIMCILYNDLVCCGKDSQKDRTSFFTLSDGGIYCTNIVSIQNIKGSGKEQTYENKTI